MAIIIVAVGSIRGADQHRPIVAERKSLGPKKRVVRFEFARWLVAGLTFQLAADIVSTSFFMIWSDVGRLAAITAIWTFLSFFLDREVEETRRPRHKDKMENAQAA